MTRVGKVLVVEANRVPDGVFGRLWIGEFAHVHLLAFQHLVVLDSHFSKPATMLPGMPQLLSLTPDGP
jgi:hypothetical protein